MAKIKLVIDNTTDIPQQILKKYDFTVLPLPVFFGEEAYRDGFDITPEEFYQKLREFDGFPKTSQVTPTEFINTYSELAKEADIIISMHLSSELSGTFNAACLASQQVEGVEIICHDSKSASMGYGFQVLEAARAIEEGCDIEEILKRINHVKESMRIYFAVASLDHLHKGGRIGRATVFLGGLLNIVPLLTLEEGIVTPAEKIRGKKRVPKRLMELVKEGIKEFGGNNEVNLSVLHTDNYQAAENLSEQIKAEYGIRDIIITQVGAIIGTHIGSGVIAVIFHKKVS